MALSSRSTALAVTSMVTAINVLVASGFSIAGIVSPHWILPPSDATSQASLIFALYAAARTLPLALFALVAIYRQAVGPLLILGGLAGLVQLLDSAIGVVQGDIGKAIGPLVIALLQFASVFYLRRTATP